LIFDNNFGKCGPIFKILYQLIPEKIIYVHSTPAVCCCTTLWNTKIQICYQIFTLNVTF